MKLLNGFLKWIATLFFSLAAGLSIFVFFGNNPDISPFLFRLMILSAIVLMSSLLLRIFFRKWLGVFLVICALITMTLTMLTIDHFYDTEYALSFVTDSFQLQMPTIQDGAQLILILVISLPILLLFRKRRKRKSKNVEPKIVSRQGKKPRWQTISNRIKVIAYPINPKNWNVKIPGLKLGKNKNTKLSTRSTHTKPQVQISNTKRSSRTSPKIKASSPKRSIVKKIKLPKFGADISKNDVKLMGDEEHVCPYCLEEVEKNDPNGVAICKECGTWHHQDCWDVTGACGVAHRNKL